MSIVAFAQNAIRSFTLRFAQVLVSHVTWVCLFCLLFWESAPKDQKKVYCCCLLCPLPWGGGINQHRVPSVCLSVCPMTQLPRLLARRTLAACILAPPATRDVRTRPRTDVDPPRFLPLLNCHRRRHIVSPPPGRYFVHVESGKFERLLSDRELEERRAV